MDEVVLWENGGFLAIPKITLKTGQNKTRAFTLVQNVSPKGKNVKVFDGFASRG